MARERREYPQDNYNLRAEKSLSMQDCRMPSARAHLHNIKVMGATLTPEEGVWLAGPVGEATRQKVNAPLVTLG